MSKFLTPPVWYDGYGTLNDMLTGKSVEEGNVVIGSDAESGANVFSSVVIYGSATGTQSAPTSNAIIAGINASASGAGVIAIGGGSSATAEGAVASGLSAKAKNTGAVAIGRNAEAEALGAIAIGDGASASSQNTIQLGSSSKEYSMRIGNGTGTINGVRLSVSGEVIQIGAYGTKYTLNVGNGESVINGYIKNGISALNDATDHGFVDVTYANGGMYVKDNISGGVYVVRVKNTSVGSMTLCTFLFEIDGYKTEYSSLFKYDGGTDSKFAVVKATPKGGGEVVLNVVDDVLSSSSELNNFKISVRRISQSYPVG